MRRAGGAGRLGRLPRRPATRTSAWPTSPRRSPPHVDSGGRHPPRAAGRGARQAGRLRRRAGPRPGRAQPARPRARLVADDARHHRQRAAPVRGVPARRDANDRPVGRAAGARRGARLVAPLLPRLHAALAPPAAAPRSSSCGRRRRPAPPVPDGVPARVVAPAASGLRRGARGRAFAAAAGAWVLTIDADTVERRTDRRGAVDAAPRRRRRSSARATCAGGEARMPSLRAGAQPRAERGLRPRAVARRARHVERRAPLSRRGDPAALARPARAARRAAGHPGAGLRRGLDASPRCRCATRPSPAGSRTPRAWRFAADYLRTFWRLWKLRNSIECADYDARAHDSAIPLQRYWQRSRHRHVTELIAGEGPVLDVGCGSSRIIGALPPGSVAVDVLLRKLRYARRFGRPLVQASGFALPFADASFPCVLCSQVIEHVPKDSPILARAGARAAPGRPAGPRHARLRQLGMGASPRGSTAWSRPAPTPTSTSRTTRAPSWSAASQALGFTHEATRYILRGELILAFRKAGTGDSGPGTRAGLGAPRRDWPPCRCAQLCCSA